jgi:AP endonuclease-1
VKLTLTWGAMFSLRADAFALFLKSQRKWSGPPMSEDSVDLFKRRLKEFGYDPAHILPHGSYLVNLGNPDAYVPTCVD